VDRSADTDDGLSTGRGGLVSAHEQRQGVPGFLESEQRPDLLPPEGEEIGLGALDVHEVPHPGVVSRLGGLEVQAERGALVLVPPDEPLQGRRLVVGLGHRVEEGLVGLLGGLAVVTNTMESLTTSPPRA
jgi:hypothetical protein